MYSKILTIIHKNCYTDPRDPNNQYTLKWNVFHASTTGSFMADTYFHYAHVPQIYSSHTKVPLCLHLISPGYKRIRQEMYVLSPSNTGKSL